MEPREAFRRLERLAARRHPAAPLRAIEPFTFALNHVLRQQAWARERLAPFAGETVEVRNPPFPPLRWTIEADGLVRSAAPAADAALVVALKPGATAALARGEEHFLRAVDVTGNARLADQVMLLARHLRWDFEEDLSRLMGDVLASRVADALRGFAAWQADAARRLAEAGAAYVGEEARMVVRRAELEALARDTAGLRDAIERLEQRMRRLG